MRCLHDLATRTALCSRLEALQPDAPRQWGQMTVDQMLRHLSIAIGATLGHGNFTPMKLPMPAPIFHFFALNLPWKKGLPTHPDFCVGERYEFTGEKARCLTLIEEFVGKPMDSAWPDSPLFGPVTGRFNSRLQAKHIDHHLRQFGA